jgi:uncharacterized flavoprotein (TIGR03862 family)
MPNIAIIGAGPAGLFAAEYLAQAGHTVCVYDRMPSPGRKLLLAGRGGLNLTHSEHREHFLQHYGEAAEWMAPMIEAFTPERLMAWCEGLGQAVFIGSSGRVFPNVFKAAPLLRAWLRRLDGLGVRFARCHTWLGLAEPGEMRFAGPDGEVMVRPDASLLALGGASWPRMGSDGAWVPMLRAKGVCVRDLRSSNCGILVNWSAPFLTRFEGAPLKRITISAGGRTARGEAVITRTGLEGGAVYALSAELRALLASRHNKVAISIDLRPDIEGVALAAQLDGPKQGRTLANFMRQKIGLSPVGVGLLQEALHSGCTKDRLSTLVKAVPVIVEGQAGLERAISSAGGIARQELDARLMLDRLPGVFAAGEMLDWEAPTGGYLLQGCFSTAAWAAKGIDDWLRETAQPVPQQAAATPS